MIERRYKYIVYFIAFTILATLGTQVYWLMKNYEINKKQVINEVQASFDLTVEKYYNELAKEKIQTLISSDTLIGDMQRMIVVKNIDQGEGHIKIRKVDSNYMADDIRIRSIKRPSDTFVLENTESSKLNHVAIYKANLDSIDDIQNLSAKIVLSFNKKDIDLIQIDSIFKVQLERNNISLSYGFNYLKTLENSSQVKSNLGLTNLPENYQKITAQSSFIPFQSKLDLLYGDINFSIFERIFVSILLSFVLSSIIIICLLFLLKTIFKQKQLSDLKNDLINNITHEFKTPIATISAALDGIQNFDIIKSPEKTTEYIDISNNQLHKLNSMVEKLLETASLHTDELNLFKEKVNLSELLKNCVDRFKLIAPDKKMYFNSEGDQFLNLDKFHFENALNNIVDNAMKYGGETIIINLKNNGEIIVQDNGHGIAKNQHEKIFDQFYRIPTGNLHNVKGFGIGLYYTRKIIEKHGGSISASESKPGKTIIRLRLNDER